MCRLPSQADVDLWCVRTDTVTDPALLARYRALLSDDELARGRQFAFERDRHRWLLTRALARTVLAGYAGCEPGSLEFARDALGKPALAWPAGLPLDFNLSHTAGLVACAVTAGEAVGIDVEDAERPVAHLLLARRFFAPSEVEIIERAPPERQREVFYEIWTLKEAYLKARGLGLSISLASFAVTPAGNVPPAIRFFTGNDAPGRWQFAQLRLGGRYQIALALGRPATGPLRILLRHTVPLDRSDAGSFLDSNPANRWSAR